MADAVTQFTTLSTDTPNVWIAQKMYMLAERHLVVASNAEPFTLPQRFGKTMRIVRYKRLAPPVRLTEGVAPDAVALAIDTVEVTVEQWGMVVSLTDVVQLTTTHPALTAAIDRTGLAMAEMMEREAAVALLSGTAVVFGGAATTRAGLVATDVITTTVVLKATAQLRTLGAPDFEGGLYHGVIHPNVEADLVKADTVFQAASNFANVRALQYAEIGVWMGVRWKRGNYLPVYQGVAAPTTGAITAEKAQFTASTTGGTLATANYQLVVIAREKISGAEVKISVQSANIAVTGATGSIAVVAPSSTAYTYDIYMTAAGLTVPYLITSGVVASATYTITTAPAGTETVATANPAVDVSVYIGWVFGKQAFGRVELSGMSLQSFITPAGASDSNPLAQRRKVGAKVMMKFFIIDNQFFVRFETGSFFPDQLPA